MSIFIIVSFYKILPICSPVTLYSESLPVKIPYLLCFGNCPSSIDLPIVIYSRYYWFDFPDTSQPPIPQYTPSLYPFPQAMETGSVLKLEIQKVFETSRKKMDLQDLTKDGQPSDVGACKRHDHSGRKCMLLTL